jgi:hypothetical protein
MALSSPLLQKVAHRGQEALSHRFPALTRIGTWCQSPLQSAKPVNNPLVFKLQGEAYDLVVVKRSDD